MEIHQIPWFQTTKQMGKILLQYINLQEELKSHIFSASFLGDLMVLFFFLSRLASRNARSPEWHGMALAACRTLPIKGRSRLRGFSKEGTGSKMEKKMDIPIISHHYTMDIYGYIHHYWMKLGFISPFLIGKPSINGLCPMVMLVYRRISGKMIPMMKDFFRWFHICWCAKCVMKKQRHHFVDLSKDVSWSSHGGVIFCRDGEKSRFLHGSTYGYRSESMWSYLIISDLSRFRSRSPIGGCCRSFLDIMEEDCYRSVASSTIRNGDSELISGCVAMDTAIRPKTDGDSIRSNKMIGTNRKNKVINYDSTQNLTCQEFRIIISKYGHEYFTDPKKQHLHCHAKYPCLCMWPAH